MNRKNEHHGLSETSEYVAWSGMIDRCVNPKNRRYKDYGGRGVSVCDKWRHSFLAFLADIGSKPDSRMSIDRINNDGNYEPGNVEWALPIKQAANRRTNRLITLDGVTKTATEWAREKGITRSTLSNRLRAGWPDDKLFAGLFEFTGNLDQYHERSRQTHCSKGHEFTPENTYVSKDGRSCRICNKARAAAYEKTRVRNRRRVAA